MPRIPQLKSCTSYQAGHDVHWIQALNVANRPAVFAKNRVGSLIAVRNFEVVIDFGADVPEVFLNHDPNRLSDIADELPREVTVNDQFCLLRVGSYCISIAPASRGPLDECPADELADVAAEALARRLKTHGGFSVPAAWIAEAIRRQSPGRSDH